jgi:hypothetical protein
MTHTPKDIFDPTPLPDLDKRLVEQYLNSGRAVDDLAYTEKFDAIYDDLKKHGDPRTKAEIFRRLLNLRKAGFLPRIL